MSKTEVELKRGQRWRGWLYFDGGEVGSVKCGARFVEVTVGSKWVHMVVERHRGRVLRSEFAHWIIRTHSTMELAPQSVKNLEDLV